MNPPSADVDGQTRSALGGENSHTCGVVVAMNPPAADGDVPTRFAVGGDDSHAFGVLGATEPISLPK